MLHDPKSLAMLAVVALFVAVNAAPVLAAARSALSGFGLPSLGKSPAPRTPGQVLDCLRSDMSWLLANTAATEADVAPVEALAKFLIHSSKPGAAA